MGYMVCSAKTSRSLSVVQGKLPQQATGKAAGRCPAGRQVVRMHQGLRFSLAPLL